MSVEAIIFEGGCAVGAAERMLLAARHAALLDNIVKLRCIPEVDVIHLVTDCRELAGSACALGATVHLNDAGRERFHFGRMLAALVGGTQADRVIYMGGASVPLITSTELRDICRTLLEARELVYTNNPQSADIVAFTPARRLLDINPPAMDNVLATALRDEAGMEMRLMPQSLGVTFDLDTPTDLVILADGPFMGLHLQRYCAGLRLDFARIRQAKKVLAGYYEDVAVIGRVGAPVIAHINKHIKCRLRIFSEERGMKALGRDSSGAVVSLLGYFLEQVGSSRLLGYLGNIARSVFWDNRVIFQHLGWEPATEDRFLSDLGCWEAIKHEGLRALTRAVLAAPIPVITGGHSLVSGGLWALTDELVRRSS